MSNAHGSLARALVGSLLVLSLTGCVPLDGGKHADKDLSTQQFSAHQLFQVGYIASPNLTTQKVVFTKTP